MNGDAIQAVYEDDWLLMVNKPDKLLIHKGLVPDEVTLLDLLQARYDQPLHVVHRLDRATSGLICLAKDPDTTKQLSQSFAQRRIQKTYLAITSNDLPVEGTIDVPLSRQTRGKRKRREASKQLDALTHFRVLATSSVSKSALVALFPKTGRQHQLRRHLRHLDAPIWGDRKYGHTRWNRELRIAYQFHRLALHAWSLSFPHPQHNQRLTCYAPLPESLSVFLDKLELHTTQAELLAHPQLQTHPDTTDLPSN